MSQTIIGQLYREVEVPKPPTLPEIAHETVREGACARLLYWQQCALVPRLRQWRCRACWHTPKLCSVQVLPPSPHPSHRHY